jgi:antitoxin VapB
LQKLIWLSASKTVKQPDSREVAKAAAETITIAVIRSLRERLARLRHTRRRPLREELLKIGKRCAALPHRDTRSDDEIVGYDEHALSR